jgi:hypothetical protein
MHIDPKKLSAMIRRRKKELCYEEPEVVTTDEPENANDVRQLETTARIEHTLDTPHKSSSEETYGESEDEAENMGPSAEEKARMGRLRRYLDGLEMHHKM